VAEIYRVATAITALAVLLATGSCGESGREEGGAVPGDALADSNPTKFSSARGPARLPVGVEYILTIVPITNRSTEPVVIERVDPLRVRGSPHVARVVGIDIVPLRPGGGSELGGGLYEIASGEDGRCPILRTVPARGYELRPGEEVLLAIRITTIAPGRFRLGAERVVYEQGGEAFYEDLPITTVLGIRELRGDATADRAARWRSGQHMCVRLRSTR
jgi:hypothetical protein